MKIICLIALLYWSLFEGFLGLKIDVFISFMFAKRLELIKGRKQLDTAPHLKFDKFHHNKRIAIKLQRCILDLWPISGLSHGPGSILSRRKPLLNTELASPGMRFHLKYTHESLRAAFPRQIAFSRSKYILLNSIGGL